MSKLSKKIILFAATIGPNSAPPNDWLSYASFLYPFLISVAAVLAVIMLIIAGLEMMTASESMRSDAKEKIQNAIIGLLLAVGTYLILNTINPDLLNLRIDTAGLKVDVQGQQGTGQSGQQILECTPEKQKLCSEMTPPRTCAIYQGDDPVLKGKPVCVK